ncbi:hypothetical protein ACPC58_08565 [Streptococcus sp. VTCC 12905]|uniref:hypothetical protein n=1 Tax=Streptococcus sp. VTCC 12905 TaxID=3413768 RepID=UPI003D9C7334
MTKSELAPYLDAVTNEDDTLLICKTEQGVFIGELSPSCDGEEFVLTYEDISISLPYAQVLSATLLKV